MLLPPPREIEFAVDLESLKYITKSSGTMALRDWLAGKDMKMELNAQFKEKAIAFMAERNLIPDKTKIIARLNSTSYALTENIGVKVQFE